MSVGDKTQQLLTTRVEQQAAMRMAL